MAVAAIFGAMVLIAVSDYDERTCGGFGPNSSGAPFARPVGINALPFIAPVRWRAISAGVRLVGKGKVSKQVVGV